MSTGKTGSEKVKNGYCGVSMYHRGPQTVKWDMGLRFIDQKTIKNGSKVKLDVGIILYRGFVRQTFQKFLCLSFFPYHQPAPEGKVIRA